MLTLLLCSLSLCAQADEPIKCRFLDEFYDYRFSNTETDLKNQEAEDQAMIIEGQKVEFVLID